MADSLRTHLDAEAAALRDAEGLLQELNGCLRRASSQDIGPYRERQEALATRLEGLRAQRGDLTRRAGEALGLPAADVTVSSIAARLPGEAASQLEAAREAAIQLARRVDSLNRRNLALARHGLAHVQERLDQLSLGPVAGCYRPDGRATTTSRCSFIEVQG